MKHVLADENVDLLAQLAWSNVLLAFDFDGTLAPIVPDRRDARMRGRTRRLLARVCERYPCAVISGRSRSDVLRRLAGTRPRYVVGNHGMEPGAATGADAARTKRAEKDLRLALRHRVGIEYENKTYSLSIHYRNARRKRETLAEIATAVEGLTEPMRMVHGKSVVNVLPPGSPNKGDALVRLRAEAGADTALFVGDDLTDEDIFALDQPGRLLAVRVGASRTSSAAYFLRCQREIDDLLGVLARCRVKETPR